MQEFPGFQPWHLGGNPYYSWREAAALRDCFNEVQKAKREANKPRK